MTAAPPLLQSALLAGEGLRHAFFTRQGGVSKGVYESLNLGRGSDDAPEAVAENRRIAMAALGLGPEALLVCHQIHSAMAVCAETAWGDDRPRADAVVTTAADLAAGVLTADCAPVLLFDSGAGVVAAAHAGWRGALEGIVEAAVLAMESRGARRDRLVAAVGPCIGPSSYEVGPEFEERFLAAATDNARFFRAGVGDRRLFDLPAFVLDRLSQAGVEKREWIGRDTAAEPLHFFSNRRAYRAGEPDYGRLLSVARP